jgi:hypothetical protein
MCSKNDQKIEKIIQKWWNGLNFGVWNGLISGVSSLHVGLYDLPCFVHAQCILHNGLRTIVRHTNRKSTACVRDRIFNNELKKLSKIMKKSSKNCGTALILVFGMVLFQVFLRCM